MHLAPENSCQTACADINTPSPVSRYRCSSASNPLVGTRTPPRRYDVRTACTSVRIQRVFQHTSFQAPSTSKRMHLLQCCDIDDSGHKSPNCYHKTPSQRNVAGRTISRRLRVITIAPLLHSSQRVLLS